MPGSAEAGHLLQTPRAQEVELEWGIMCPQPRPVFWNPKSGRDFIPLGSPRSARWGNWAPRHLFPNTAYLTLSLNVQPPSHALPAWVLSQLPVLITELFWANLTHSPLGEGEVNRRPSVATLMPTSHCDNQGTGYRMWLQGMLHKASLQLCPSYCRDTGLKGWYQGSAQASEKLFFNDLFSEAKKP